MRKRAFAVIIPVVVFLIGLLCLAVAFWFLLGSLLKVDNTLINGFLTVIFTVGATILAAFVTPMVTLIKNLQEFLFYKGNLQCRIFIFGLGGTGKTTFIQSLLFNNTTRPRETIHFEYYDSLIQFDMEKKIPLRVKIADFQGQNPHQILSDLDEEFFGIPGSRLINTIIIIVDMFDSPNTAIHPDSWLDNYRDKAHEKITERVQFQSTQLPELVVNFILAIAFNIDHTSCVKVLINKVDMLREVVALGYIPQVANATDESLYNYATSLYSGLIERIKECLSLTLKQQYRNKGFKNNELELKANGLINQIFKVDVVSAMTGDKINMVNSDIYDKFVKSMGAKNV